MIHTIRRYGWAVVLALAMVAIPLTEGCKTKLAPGPYNPTTTNAVGEITEHPNVAAYKSDLAVTGAKKVIEGFLAFEYENRATLKTALPEATKFADQLRLKAPPAIQAAARASKAYLEQPTAANKSTFDQAMAVLDPLVAAAQGYFTQSLGLR